LRKRYFNGKGIEIGPGNNPYLSNNNNVFVDRYIVDKKKENYFEADAGDLPFEADTFNFLISAHCLEHCPNTIKILEEWKRVLKPNGNIILILPHAERTFDKGRSLTTVERHIEDARMNITEKDYINDNGSHRFILDESAVFFENHHHKWLEDARSSEGKWDFDWLASTGNIHYHVWTQNEIGRLLNYLGLNILLIEERMPGRSDSFVVIAKNNNK
jgi:SAM-dependent methyltransferase